MNHVKLHTGTSFENILFTCNECNLRSYQIFICLNKEQYVLDKTIESEWYLI